MSQDRSSPIPQVPSTSRIEALSNGISSPISSSENSTENSNDPSTSISTPNQTEVEPEVEQPSIRLIHHFTVNHYDLPSRTENFESHSSQRRAARRNLEEREGDEEERERR